MDVVVLSKLQFALTIMYHFLFVPLSIGGGLILVLAERRYYKSGAPEDKAASDLWVRLFTATFAIGVATGITMEFAFGTNWATYSRFVGDIFGAPLAAEGLFAFFLESSFLGILLFGRSRVSKRFFYISAWLVWLGSLLSALWIIIANSWMQTPAGYEVVEVDGGTKAELTDFFAAALNPSTLPRYFHTIDSVLIVGGFVAMGLAAYYMRRGVHLDFARKTMATGVGVAIVFSVLMLPLGHWQAVTVIENQPTKAAAMEGHWDEGPMPLGIIGYVDAEGRRTFALEIPGGASFMTDWDFDTSLPGLNDFAPEDLPPLQITYQSYHIMIMLWGVMLLIALGAWWLRRAGKLERGNGFLRLLTWAPILPMLAIQLGWATAEVGRQPWIVWGELRTVDAISKAVPAGEILTTIILFTVIYTLLYVAWARVVIGIIRKGPVESVPVATGRPDAVTPAAAAVVVPPAVPADSKEVL